MSPIALEKRCKLLLHDHWFKYRNKSDTVAHFYVKQIYLTIIRRIRSYYARTFKQVNVSCQIFVVCLCFSFCCFFFGGGGVGVGFVFSFCEISSLQLIKYIPTL